MGLAAAYRRLLRALSCSFDGSAEGQVPQEGLAGGLFLRWERDAMSVGNVDGHVMPVGWEEWTRQ
jgi:hypothetical protein